MQSGRIALIDQPAGERTVPSTLVELLRQRAEQYPEKRAYTFLVDGEGEEVSLSYGELDARARVLAQALVGQGLSRERALLLYPPGLDFIAGFFGCLYAGLVAIPAYPPDPARLKRTLKRLEAIVADAKARVALTTGGILSSLGRVVAQAPVLGAMTWVASDAADAALADQWTPVDSTGDDIAFLQYTSGSTGAPKGVMLSHANLLHNASIVNSFFRHGGDDKYLSWLPTFHDMGFMAGVLQPLYSAIPAVLMSPEAFLQRPLRWLQAISRHKATTSGGPNFAYDLCAKKISPEERAALDLSSWEVAFNGAEPVRKETLDRFARTFEPCGFNPQALYPCYGLAEATLIVTGSRKGEGPVVAGFQPSALEKGRAIAATSGDVGQHFLAGCGRPSEDERVVIVNPETATTCPHGEVGEVWVCGPSVGLGYWNRPAETEETFRAYTADTSEGPFLRTGDLGFIDGGELFVTARLKDLIIIRGVNHYPQDIELTAEKSHPAVRPGCGAAFSVEDGGEERLVVVHEVDARKYEDPCEVADCIRRSVSEGHDVQVRAVVLVKPGTIPKTSSGKIQRRACREEFLEGRLEEVHRSELEDGFAQPVEESFFRKALLAAEPHSRQGVAESYILEQAARSLGLSASRLDAGQPLSVFGMDSLMALDLKNRVETDLGVSVPLSKLLDGSSARHIAAVVLDELGGGAASLAGLGGAGEAAANQYPLSFTQKALWFFYQLAPQSAAYNIAFAVRINSPIDVAVFEAAFQDLVDRHTCLRTTFDTSDGQPVQQVHGRLQARLRKLPAAALSEEELQCVLTEEAYRPFDLERGPVYRASLFTQSEDEHVLLLAMHHIIADGWSFWVLLGDLVELYEARVSGARRLLPAPAFKYSDYVRWQAETLAGSEGDRLLQYWKQELSGDLPVLDLPTSRPRPPVQTYSGASVGFELDERLVRQLKGLAASRGVTLYMALLAAFQLLLHRHTGQNDILVGSPISARSRAEFEGVVGCFFNAVVLRADFSRDKTFAEFLGQVRDKVLAALDHQEYPSHLLVERLQPVRDPSRPPLFQATFILQKQQRQARTPICFGGVRPQTAGAGLALSFVPIERRHARLELELEMIEADGAIHAWLHYNRDLFDAEAVARMSDHYRGLLEGAAADPDERLSNLPMLTQGEVARLLTDETLDLGPCHYSGVEEMFREQARKSPAKVAAVYNGNSITFRALDQRSDRLASLISKLPN